MKRVLNPRIESPWDLAFATSLVAFAVALGFAVVPSPARVDPSVGPRKSLGDAQAATSKADALARRGHARVVSRTWTMEPEALGVQVMGAVGLAAERRHLEVSNFTAGRAIPSAGLRQIPFAVTLTGLFPDVLAAMAELEKPSSRLVIGGVKFAPNAAGGVADGSAGTAAALGRVTATLSITAFLRGRARSVAALSRPVVGLAVVGVVATLALLLNPSSDPSPKGTPAPAKRRTGKKPGEADWDLPAPDPKLRFGRVANLPRNVFVPLVAPERPLGTLPTAVMKDDLVQIPAKLAGGEGAWAYTGMVEANGVRMALLENKGLNQSGYVREGEAWKAARVVGISSACIVLADEKGLTETVFRFDPNAPAKPKAEPGSAPSFGPGGVGAPLVGPLDPSGLGSPIRPLPAPPNSPRSFTR